MKEEKPSAKKLKHKIISIPITSHADQGPIEIPILRPKKTDRKVNTQLMPVYLSNN